MLVPEAPLQVTLPAPHPDVPWRVLSNHRDGSALDLACSSDRKLKNNEYFTIWLGICTMGEWKPDACTVGSQWSRAIWCSLHLLVFRLDRCGRGASSHFCPLHLWSGIHHMGTVPHIFQSGVLPCLQVCGFLTNVATIENSVTVSHTRSRRRMLGETQSGLVSSDYLFFFILYSASLI